MNNVKGTTCAYCGEQTTDVAVSGQRCINKNSSALYPYLICHACYTILGPPKYLTSADRIKGKQIFWEKVDKNLRKKKWSE